MATEINLDISAYPKAKKAKQARIVKIDGAVYYSRTTFDPTTGEATPQLVPLEREAIEATISRQEESLAALKLLLTDFDAAKELQAK
jgi:hypothetical protein